MLNSDDSLHKVVYSGKHIFLIILGAVFGLSVRAQTFFYEDFSATTMPQGWVIEPFPGQQYNLDHRSRQL